MNRRTKKLAGVCSQLGDVFNIDPTFLRIGFVAVAIIVSWKLALLGYIGAGVYLHVQKNRANERFDVLRRKLRRNGQLDRRAAFAFFRNDY